MIIKATLVALVVILVVVIATSYYVNKEGFDNITTSQSNIIDAVKAKEEADNDVITATAAAKTALDAKMEAIKLVEDITKEFDNAKKIVDELPTTATDAEKDAANATKTSKKSQLDLAITAKNTAITNNTTAIENKRIADNKALETRRYLNIVINNTIEAEKEKKEQEEKKGQEEKKDQEQEEDIITHSAKKPTRNDIVPEVGFSEIGYNALILKQKSDLLKDIQKVVRNEVIAKRCTTPMLNKDYHEYDDEYSSCDNKSINDKITVAASQGKEYENSCYKDKKSGGACPPQPDMAQFIKKDAIPCWGCSLDY